MSYVFTFPADTPPMTFEALAARLASLCDSANCLADCIEIGSTVQARWNGRSHDKILVRLYQTTIAILGKDGTIQFPNDDPHMTTTRWIERIVYDNGLGHRVGRIPRRVADGPGPELPRSRGKAGLLVIDWDRSAPVHGRVWAVDRERIARNRDFREQWAASMAFRSLHPEEWAADLAAAKPHQGTPDYRDRVDPALWRGSAHEPDLADIR